MRGPSDVQENRAAHAELNSEMRRRIPVFPCAAGLERLPRLHHTGPRSSFKGARGSPCEAKPPVTQTAAAQRREEQILYE